MRIAFILGMIPAIIGITVAIGMLTMVDHAPGADGSCVNKFPPTQDLSITWRDSGFILEHPPLDPFQE